MTHRFIIIIFLVFITSSSGAFAMSFLKPGKTCVFSDVKAVLTKNGEPLRNVKVIRKWEWKELKEEQTQTDENGVFTFPAVFESSLSRFLPSELVIAQGLYVEIDGAETKFWSNSKRDPEENSEFSGSPIVLNCELSDEMKIYKKSGSRMRTLCKWENM